MRTQINDLEKFIEFLKADAAAAAAANEQKSIEPSRTSPTKVHNNSVRRLLSIFLLIDFCSLDNNEFSEKSNSSSWKSDEFLSNNEKSRRSHATLHILIVNLRHTINAEETYESADTEHEKRHSCKETFRRPSSSTRSRYRTSFERCSNGKIGKSRLYRRWWWRWFVIDSNKWQWKCTLFCWLTSRFNNVVILGRSRWRSKCDSSCRSTGTCACSSSTTRTWPLRNELFDNIGCLGLFCYAS